MRERIKDWASTISSLLSLLAIVTFFVTQWAKIEKHDAMISFYESHGTPAVRDMKATYDERFKSQADRIDKLESIANLNSAGIQDIKTELRANVERLISIKESLEDHKRQMDHPKP